MNSNPHLAAVEDHFPDAAHHAEGVQLVHAGDYEGAIEAFRKALQHNTDRADTHFMLGSCFSNTGKMEQALDHYQTAGLLAPTYTKCWVNLCKTRVKVGRYREALSAMRQARKYAQNPNDIELIQVLLQCIAPMEEFDINPQIVEEVTCCFQTPGVPSERLVHTAQKLLLHQVLIKKLIEHYSGGKIRDFDTLLSEQHLNWVVLGHPLFVRLLSDHHGSHPDLENIFSAMRSHLLEKASKQPLSDAALWPNALHFIAALAQHCFMGEYVYDTNDKELKQIEAIEKRISKSADPYDVALLACYKPLFEFAGAEGLAADQNLQAIAPLAELIRTQITEPATEKEIIKTLDNFTSIDDEISLMVKEQYETFPYPRWTTTGVEHASSLRHIMRLQFPFLDPSLLPPDDFRTNVLIAGCGTGKQSVGNAMLIPNADYTAVDLTAASLAYATRKTRELGIENIRYGLGDILKLEELNQQFDVIHCGGVLHHMRDPMAGWRVLEKILKPGGFMAIALYSEIARRSIVAAREHIAQHNIGNTAEGIREIRKHVKGLPDSHPMKSLMTHRDFYSMSECRDLLFHVQEHRFTTLQIKKSIEELGLEFIGFQRPLAANALANYKATYPDDPYATDLENWHEFELKNPTIFVGMYQFWLHKPA